MKIFVISIVTVFLVGLLPANRAKESNKYIGYQKDTILHGFEPKLLVGVRGFEPPTTWTPFRRSWCHFWGIFEPVLFLIFPSLSILVNILWTLYDKQLIIFTCTVTVPCVRPSRKDSDTCFIFYRLDHLFLIILEILHPIIHTCLFRLLFKSKNRAKWIDISNSGYGHHYYGYTVYSWFPRKR